MLYKSNDKCKHHHQWENRHHVPPNRILYTTTVSVRFQPKLNRDLIMRKHQTIQNQDTVYNMILSSKMIRSWELKKYWGIVPNQRRLERGDTWEQPWSWILGYEEHRWKNSQPEFSLRAGDIQVLCVLFLQLFKNFELCYSPPPLQLCMCWLPS